MLATTITELAVVGIAMKHMMRPGVPALARARAGPVASPHRGHILASRSIRARQCGHMRTVLLGPLAGAPKDEAKTFLNRRHWNQSLACKDMPMSEVRGP